MATPPTFTTGAILTAAQMNSVGLWLVKTQAVSAGVTSFTVTGAFSADYDNYKIIWTGIGGTSGNSATMTLNGSAGATYNWSGRYSPFTGAYGDGQIANNGGGLWLGIMGAGYGGEVDLLRPFTATPTNAIGQSSSGTYYTTYGGYDSNAASSTAFTITLAAGVTTAGTVTVYGYRK